jgi:hypothetical protein
MEAACAISDKHTNMNTLLPAAPRHTPKVEGLVIKELGDLLCNKTHKKENIYLYICKDGKEDIENEEKGEVDAKKERNSFRMSGSRDGGR